MKEIIINGYTVLCDDEDYELHKKGRVNVDDKKYKSIFFGSRILSRLLMECYDTNMVVDHINGNSLDNRKENLRIITKQENTRNIKIREGQIYFGVVYMKSMNRYRTQFESGKIIKDFNNKHDAIIHAYGYVSENWPNEREKRTLEEILKDNPQHVCKSMEVKCDLCDSTFYSISTKNMHMAYIHNPEFIECEICKKKYKTNKLLEHMKNVHGEDEQIECDLCEEKFKNYTSLHKHKTRFHSEEVYNCDLCDFTSKYKDNITKHKLNKHSTEKFKCSECDSEFASQHYLTTHIKSVHTKSEEACPVCGNIYENHVKMMRHWNRMHKVSKIHQCDLCNYNTKEVGNLNRHVKTVHK